MQSCLQLDAAGQRVLADVFGFEAFRAGQAEAVAAALAGKDVLVLLPTGAGKSLCYQVPAITLHRQGHGTTLVISPLVALMNDQVAALAGRGIAAAAIHSHIGPDEQADTIRRLLAGDLALLYISPERAAMDGFQRLLKRATLCLLAIDEAHCVSQWGHDFRPDYLALGDLRRHLDLPCMALTATATPHVLSEISKTLDLDEPVTVRGGFARPNLTFAVQHLTTDAARMDALITLLTKAGLNAPRSGRAIVYCSTRAVVERVTEQLKANGWAAAYYHAGRTPLARERAERGFAKNKARVLVATNAFGMGVDYADVRLVVHFQAPGSLEAYYQEAGRAGRDGLPATCVLFFGKRDVITQQRLTSHGAARTAERAAHALAALCAYAQSTTCRHTQLCVYFGDAATEDCGRCDACQGIADVAQPVAPVGTVLAAPQQATIIEAATWLPRPVGKRALIGALLGSRAKHVASAGLLNAPFWGTLAGVVDHDLDATIEHLIAARVLRRLGRKYPTIAAASSSTSPSALTTKGRTARGTAPPTDAPARASVRSIKPATRFRKLGIALDLDTYRRKTARALGWKAYMVFPSGVIKAIDERRPMTLADLARIPGLGPARLARFGDDILRIVRADRT